MGKGKACIAIFCIATTALFCIMSWLMLSVNPPPIVVEEDKSLRTQEEKFGNVVFNDVPSAADGYQYGLEKHDPNGVVTPEKIGLALTTENYNSLWRYTPKRVVPPLWPMTTTPTAKTDITRTPGMNIPEIYFLNATEPDHETDVPDIFNSNATLTIPVIKRSVKELNRLRNNHDLGSIILKIIDDSGNFKIEIKLNSNDSIRSLKENKKSKPKFSLSLKTNDEDNFKKIELAQNTLISIITNDSININEYDENNLEADKKTKYSLIEASNETISPTEIQNTIANTKKVNKSQEDNVTDTENILFMKHSNYNITTATPKDIFTINVLYDNKTKSIKYLDKKTSNYDKIYILNDTKILGNMSDEHKSGFKGYNENNSVIYNESSTVPMDNLTTHAENISTTNSETIQNESTKIEAHNSTVQEMSTFSNGNVTLPFKKKTTTRFNISSIHSKKVTTARNKKSKKTKRSKWRMRNVEDLSSPAN